MRVYPIGFSIPACKVVDCVPPKTRKISPLIPGDTSTYVYKSEAEYYQQYRDSQYAHTWKKGGWDCMRHYEILANGCIPLFRDLEKCPSRTIVHYPRHLRTAEELLAYTREHLTTRAMAQYVLDTVGRPDARSILYLSSNTKPDYLRCLMLHGFKEVLGGECHDVPRISHIYTDYPEGSAQQLYGGGFTYSRLLSPELHDDRKNTTLEEDIQSHRYDLIIYGSIHRGGTSLDGLVHQYYSSEEIIAFCGEDCDDGSAIHNCQYKNTPQLFGHLFVRELD